MIYCQAIPSSRDILLGVARPGPTRPNTRQDIWSHGSMVCTNTMSGHTEQGIAIWVDGLRPQP